MDQLRKDRVHLNAQLPELEPAYRIKAEAMSTYQHHYDPKSQFFLRREFLNGGSQDLVSDLLLHIGTRYFLIHSRHLKQLCVPDVNGRPDQSDVA
ncbi:Uncharacterised protein [Acinetobacter baumannii]|nr:Uncharacterised protein [Acinetobacter baumannii]